MAANFEEFKKRYEKLKTPLSKLGDKDIDFKFNNLASFAIQLSGVEEGLAEAIADCQDQGNKGKSLGDFAQDKEVKKGQRDFDSVYGRLEEEIKSVRGLVGMLPNLEKLTQKLRNEIDEAFGKKPTGKDKDKVIGLTKELDSKLTGMKSLTKFAKDLPAYERLVKEQKTVIAGIVEKAKRMPRKPEKGLPKDIKNDQSVGKLKDEVKEIFKLAGGKGIDGMSTDELQEKLTRLEQIESMIQGALKDSRRTLKQAGHYDFFEGLSKEIMMPKNKLKRLCKVSEKAESDEKKSGRA